MLVPKKLVSNLYFRASSAQKKMKPPPPDLRAAIFFLSSPNVVESKPDMNIIGEIPIKEWVWPFFSFHPLNKPLCFHKPIR